MQGKSRRGSRRLRYLGRRGAATAGLLVAAAAMSPAGAAHAASADSSSGGSTTVVAGDSIVVTSLPSFGPTTITVTRPDAITGAPVTIGLESGTGNQFTPFSANTITPSPLDPSGDCWQQGALSQALTPDIQPGDTVVVSQAGVLGGTASSSSTAVQPSDETGAATGPIAGCAAIAPWARNAITNAPSTLGSGSALTVSGVAQPLATAVSVSASDGTNSTTPVSTTPGAGGAWTATVPAQDLASLGGGKLTVTPVMAVPDVSTGAPAHIAGVGATVNLETTPPGRAPGSPGHSRPKSHPTARVTAVRVAKRLSLARARKRGIRVSFVVPRGVHVARIQLSHRGKRVFSAYIKSDRGGRRQAFTIPARKAKHLHTARYSLAIQVGARRSALGPAVIRTIVLSRA
jgi:hypothetical protein